MDIDAFAKRNQEKIKMFFCMLLVLVLGFSAGYCYRDENSSESSVSIQAASQDCSRLLKLSSAVETSTESGKVASVSQERTSDIAEETVQIKAFASSKNSNLYHKATCQYVKRIKSENLVWFNTVEEAENSGRKPHSCVQE